MNFFQAIFLGIVQGLTEFLPVSSSAHLVLFPFYFGWKFPEEQVFVFDVLVQLGTLVAVIVYFWKDLWQVIVGFTTGLIQRKPFETYSSKLGWYLILATIPAGLAGLVLKSKVEQAFQDAGATGACLIVTAVVLVLGEHFGRKERPLESIRWMDALWIGISQIISIFPGVSRSGSTISGALLCGFDRRSAGRFSFLMSIPIMLAASLLAIKDLLEIPGWVEFVPVVLGGFLAALVVGFFAIHWLMNYLKKQSLYAFSLYCGVMGVITIIMAIVRGGA